MILAGNRCVAEPKDVGYNERNRFASVGRHAMTTSFARRMSRDAALGNPRIVAAG
jgi:hypothetical protein